MHTGTKNVQIQTNMTDTRPWDFVQGAILKNLTVVDVAVFSTNNNIFTSNPNLELD